MLERHGLREGEAAAYGKLLGSGLLLAWLMLAAVGPSEARGETASEVVAGDAHTCALTTGGGVQCWGQNSSGQLGDGTQIDSSIPVGVSGLESGVAALAAGEAHTCALTTGGGVLCWGRNSSGQLGDGTTTSSPVPVAVSGLGSGIATIAAGEEHACALTTGGAVLCWGWNSSGQLGDGTTTSSAVPVAVSGLGSGVAALAEGGSGMHSCAVTSGGDALCWGRNSYGQLGNGTTTDSSVPVAVSILAGNVAALAAGDDHSCALTTSGGAWCWGRNHYGQLGIGIPGGRLTATPVDGLGSGVAVLAAGTSHSCAVTSGGDALCWGRNSYGQLGDGTKASTISPAAVGGIAGGLVDVATGDRHSCAITSGGALWCWGSNQSGQLADGTVTQSGVPVAALATGVTALTGGGSTCALDAAGGVQCWGSNFSGQLGDGTNTDSSVPVEVSGLGSGIAALAGGRDHACALDAGGGVLCWGSNFWGQLGDGSTTSSNVPVAVSGLGSGVAALAAGGRHTCARTTDGAVLCWGANSDGQLGDGTTTDSSVPVPVSGLDSGVAALVAGGSHSCALTTGGDALCWGDNSLGQLAYGGTATDSSVPVPVSHLGSDIAALTAGERHTCALTTGGAALCWGSNLRGQLGDGTTDANSLSPVAVSGLDSGVAALEAGQDHTCALTTGGAALCWGWNVTGQLGDGTFADSNVPVGVSGLGSGVVAIAGSGGHTCALDTGSSVWCWGRNNVGQLGDGHVATRPTPVLVAGFGLPNVPGLGGPALGLLTVTLGLAGRRASRRRVNREPGASRRDRAERMPRS